MTATIVMALAIVLYIIALLDQGRTAEIARGFAWLFFIGAAYAAIPAYTGAIQSVGNKPAQPRSSKVTFH